MAVDKIVRCRNWMRKIIDAPNVDGWQNMVDTPDDDFTDPDFANDVDKDDFDNRYPEYVKKLMLRIEKYQGKEISDVEYVEYEKKISKRWLEDTKEISDAEYEEYEKRRISKIFLEDTKTSEKKEKEPEAKTLKEKETYEERQERYYKGFEAMQKKYPYLTDMEISEKLIAEKDKESYKDNNDLLDAIKDYERIHGNNSFHVQIERIYKLMKNGTKFDTAFKKCKIHDSYKKHVMKALQKLKEKLKEKK